MMKAFYLAKTARSRLKCWEGREIIIAAEFQRPQSALSPLAHFHPRNPDALSIEPPAREVKTLRFYLPHK